MDVGAELAAVALAEAIVIHAVFRLLPAPPLPGLSDDGQTALQSPAVDTWTREACETWAHRALSAQPQGHTWPRSDCSCWPGPVGLWRERPQAGSARPPPGLCPLTCLAQDPLASPPLAQALLSLSSDWVPARPIGDTVLRTQWNPPTLVPCRSASVGRRVRAQRAGPVAARLPKATLVAGQWADHKEGGPRNSVGRLPRSTSSRASG